MGDHLRPMDRRTYLAFSLIRMIVFLSIVPCALGYSGPSDPYYTYENRNTFDPHVDYNQIGWFDRGIYQSALERVPCLDMNEFYAYADSDPFDSMGRDDIKGYSDRLGYSDYQRLASEDQYDGITNSDLWDRNDLRCSTLNEFNSWRQDKPMYSSNDYFRMWDFDSQADLERYYDHSTPDDYNSRTYFNGFARDDGNGAISSIVPIDQLENPRRSAFAADYRGYASDWNSYQFDSGAYSRDTPWGSNPYSQQGQWGQRQVPSGWEQTPSGLRYRFDPAGTEDPSVALHPIYSWMDGLY